MICAYAIFCEKVSVSTPKHISADDIFSSLTLDEPGTTEMSFLIGITGIKKGKKETLLVQIKLADGKNFSAKWESPVSSGEYDVYNAVFNCNKIPFEKSGLHHFIILSGETKTEIGRRHLKVNIGNIKKDDANE